MSLLDIYSSDITGSIRKGVIKDIVPLEFLEDQVIQKKKMWLEMKTHANAIDNACY